MGQTQKVQGVATSIFTENGMTNIRYHQTVVVSFNHEKIILNSGGYHTVTTKLRMNQASNQFGLGYDVYQKDFNWFVGIPGTGTVEYFDGMEIPRS